MKDRGPFAGMVGVPLTPSAPRKEPMTTDAQPSEEAVKAAREVVAEWDRKFDADEPQGWADITAREWLIRHTALLIDRREAQAMERAARVEKAAAEMGTLAAKLSINVIAAFNRDGGEMAVAAFGSNAMGHVANELANACLKFKMVYQEKDR